MRLALFQVPYDAGHFGLRMGRGPLHLIERGLARGLEADGHDLDLVPVRLEDGFWTEAGSAVEIHRRLARGAAAARAEGRLPVVLAGNCNASLGAVAACPPGSVGILWLDAHGDFNSPETSTSGFIDGMALSMITGGVWQTLAATVPGFHPVAERDVVLVGARDLDPGEEERLRHSHIARVAAEDVPDGLEIALDHLARRVRLLHVHIDLDVLDLAVGRANSFAVPGGLSLMQMELLMAAAAARFEIASVSLTAYDPDQDPDDRILRVARTLLTALLETIAG